MAKPLDHIKTIVHQCYKQQELYFRQL